MEDYSLSKLVAKEDKVYIFSQKKLVLSTKDTVISLSQMQKTEFQVMRKLFIDIFSNFELFAGFDFTLNGNSHF